MTKVPATTRSAVAGAGAPESRPSFREVLALPNFYRLWAGQIVSSVGDRFYQLALLSMVFKIANDIHIGQNSARIAFVGILPGVFFGPWFGWAVDAFERRALMIFADIARVVLTLSMLVVWFDWHWLPGVYGIIFLMGALNGLFIPARQAALPQLVEPRQLVTANSLIALIGVIASLVGSAFGGIIVSIFGARSSFIVNAAGFLFSAWFIYRIDRPLRPDAHAEVNERLRSNWRELSAGWRILRERPELLGLVALNILFAFVSGVFLITVLEHVVTNVDLGLAHTIAGHLGEFLAKFAPKPPVFDVPFLALGFLMATIGLGLGAGVGFCGKSRVWSRWRAMPFLCLALLGLGMIGFAHLQTFGPALLGSMGLGFLGSIIAIPIEARLQDQVDDAHRGRVFALRNLGTSAAFVLALGLNVDGRLLAWRGAGTMIGDLGVFVLVAVTILAIWQRKGLTTFWQVHPQESGE